MIIHMMGLLPGSNNNNNNNNNNDNNNNNTCRWTQLTPTPWWWPALPGQSQASWYWSIIDISRYNLESIITSNNSDPLLQVGGSLRGSWPSRASLRVWPWLGAWPSPTSDAEVEMSSVCRMEIIRWCDVIYCFSVVISAATFPTPTEPRVSLFWWILTSDLKISKIFM